MGTQLPSRKRGGAPSPIWPNVYCGQTAGLIKMALDMEVGLGPGRIVLDGERVPLPQKAGRPPSQRNIMKLALYGP